MPKKHKPFMTSDLAGKGFIEVRPNHWVKSVVTPLITDPIKKIVSEMEVPKKAKRSKYGVSVASERTYKGKVYDSKLECQYRMHIDLLVKSERVVSISEQVPFLIVVNDKPICKYLLDFEVVYFDGTIQYVDCKGVLTAIYKLKKKLVEAQFGIVIWEIKKGGF